MAGWILVALSLTALVGWVFHLPTLVSIPRALDTIKTNAALAFLLAGVALLRRKARDLPLYSLGVMVHPVKSISRWPIREWDLILKTFRDQGHWGLISMRERVKLVNRTMIIEAKPTGGTTTIRVRVPFNQKRFGHGTVPDTVT